MTIEKQKKNKRWETVSRYFQAKGWLHLLLIGGLVIFCLLILKTGPTVGIAYGVLPLSILGLIILLKYTQQSFYVLFGLQLVFVLATMIVEVRLGILTLLLTLFIAALFIIRNIYHPIDFSTSKNFMFYIFLGWGIYCFAELANPNNVMEAWNIAISHYVIYPLACAILVPLAIRNIKGIEWLLFIWSLFILIAALKGYWQKNYGFSERDLYFLYVQGGAKTHIIWSGIRYFSCFTDAANFGVHMSMAVTCFLISLFYIKRIWVKLYFVIIIIAAFYCIGISGTRSAVAVPLTGFVLFAFLSRSKRYGIISILFIITAFIFFRFTTFGDGNDQIRRIRSAFKPTEDASYQVRVINRARMKELMIHKPMGYGLGLAKGDRFASSQRMPYPPDSWLVSVWVETGYIGLILYIVVHGILFAWCSWILMFKITNNRLRGLLAAWLCMNAGFFVVTYTSDVMQYPNQILIYTGFALCISAPYIKKDIDGNQ